MASGPSSGRPVRGFMKSMAATAFGAAMVLGFNMASCHAQGGPGKAKEAERPPIVVTARSLLADNKKKLVIYQKNVVVKRGDVTLYADQVTVHLAPADKTPGPATPKDPVTGGGKVDTIEAEGNVKIVQQDKTSTSDKAVFYNATDKIVLTGQPKVWQGENVIIGTKITYDIKEDTFLVDDAKSVLYQGAKKP
jgi:lipopolysaccharide export system protein LptA